MRSAPNWSRRARYEASAASPRRGPVSLVLRPRSASGVTAIGLPPGPAKPVSTSPRIQARAGSGGGYDGVAGAIGALGVLGEQILTKPVGRAFRDEMHRAPAKTCAGHTRPVTAGNAATDFGSSDNQFRLVLRRQIGQFVIVDLLVLTAAPMRICDRIHLDMPKPRDTADPSFLAIKTPKELKAKKRSLKEDYRD